MKKRCQQCHITFHWKNYKRYRTAQEKGSNSIEGSEEQQTNKMKYAEVGIQKEVSTIISRPTVMEEGVCLPENKVTNNGTMKSMLGIGREG